MLMNLPGGRPPRVICYTDTDMVHSAYAMSGLIELADQQAIKLQFGLSPHLRPRPRGPFTLWLEIFFSGSIEPFSICCDFHDRASYTCPASLAACDLYFKSNFSQKTLEAVDEDDRAKIRPFGLYTPCRPEHDRALARRQLGNSPTFDIASVIRAARRLATRPASSLANCYVIAATNLGCGGMTTRARR
jgi:hypothetical protein